MIFKSKNQRLGANREQSYPPQQRQVKKHRNPQDLDYSGRHEPVQHHPPRHEGQTAQYRTSKDEFSHPQPIYHGALKRLDLGPPQTSLDVLAEKLHCEVYDYLDELLGRKKRAHTDAYAWKLLGRVEWAADERGASIITGAHWDMLKATRQLFSAKLSSMVSQNSFPTRAAAEQNRNGQDRNGHCYGQDLYGQNRDRQDRSDQRRNGCDLHGQDRNDQPRTGQYRGNQNCNGQDLYGQDRNGHTHNGHNRDNHIALQTQKPRRHRAPDDWTLKDAAVREYASQW